MTATNIASTLFAIAARQPDVPAIIYRQRNWFKRDYAQLTFGQLAERVQAVASGLQAAGFERGDRVILLVPPSVDFFVLCYAMLRAAIVPVVIDPGIGRPNLLRCIADVEAVGFIGVTKAQAARVALGWGKPTIRKLVTVGPRLFWGGRRLAQIEAIGRKAPTELVATNPTETAAIVFTSGSTGPPKGVVYSHRNFQTQLQMLRATFAVEPGARDLPTFPPFALFNPSLGVTSIIPEMDATKPGSVNAGKLFAAIDRFEVQTLFGSPALMRRVASYGVAHGISLPTIGRTVSAGAPMAAATLRMWRTLLPAGVEVFTPYGATEGMPISVIGSDEILNETQALTDAGAGICVGAPVAGVKVAVVAIDDDAQSWEEAVRLPAGAIGEFVVQGDNVTGSYFGNPTATAAAKIGDGDAFWHRMGDVGYLDAQGRLWYCGRKAHIVWVAGKPLYSVQCEAIFNKHDAVYRTALVEAAGQAVLCVEFEPGRDDRVAVLEELQEWAADNELTQAITIFLVHPGFPVDIRHNAKIFREKLRPWAEAQLANRQADSEQKR